MINGAIKNIIIDKINFELKAINILLKTLKKEDVMIVFDTKKRTVK